MAYNGNFYNDDVHVNQHACSSSVSLRDTFLVWLSKKQLQYYTPEVLANCIDSISQYVLRKKICVVGLWNFSQHSEFQGVYNRLLNDWLLRITDRNAYKVFLTAGQLYSEFLKDKSYENVRVLSDELTVAEYTKTSVLQDLTVLSPTEKSNGMTFLVDFNNTELCEKTRPINCLIKGRAIVLDKQSWARLLVLITERFIEDKNPHLDVLSRKPIYGNKVFFMPNKADVGASTLLSNGKWISTTYDTPTIVLLIGKLCQHCGVALKDVSISYIPKDASPIKHVENGKKPLYAHAVNQAVFEPKVLEAVTGVLLTHFPNGFRVDSPIEIMRFRNFADESSAESFQLSDEELKKAILSCGTLFEGKVFVVRKETENKIQKEIEQAVESGTDIFYYTPVYNRHENWLIASSVISEDMLIGILKKLFPSYQHKANYFSIMRNKETELAIIRNEIMRVWNGNTLLNYEQISERLPYIPLDKIKYVLAQNGDFIWNSTTVYTHIGNVDISDEEQTDIANYVANTCQSFGYASICDVPLGEIEVRNFELTQTAIHNAVFAIVLSDKYDKRGKIVTRKGDTLDALTIMKEHCRTIDRCSLQDLLDYERDLTGETHRWIPMEAGYAVLVRTAYDTFAAERYVRFDINRIDDVLDLFVTGDYLPLKGVTTFAAFPHCGQVWNLFLLESFCRKFSSRFHFEVLAVNSRNTGTIVRNSCSLSYIEIMADAVAASDAELEKTNVAEFLYDRGYIGKRSYSKTNELIERAKAIREMRN